MREIEITLLVLEPKLRSGAFSKGTESQDIATYKQKLQ
jgi:hypothetical protein